MPLFISLINYTEQGVKNMKDLPARVAAAQKAIEAKGGKLHGFHLTLGQYDAVAVIEAPSDEAYTSFALSIASQGNLRTTTLKAFSQEESLRIAGGLP